MKSNQDRSRKVGILVVQESLSHAAQLAHLLEHQGYAVTTATNGREALALLDQSIPTLIISDVQMSELDGYDLCRAIKSSEQWKDIPVMLVTTLSDAQDVVRSLECGANDLIRKPYAEKYLLSRIDNLLMNVELRKTKSLQEGVEVDLGGERHFISSERQQILDLLISTYEQAVSTNGELKSREKELAHSSQVLNGLFRIAEGLNRATSEREVAELALERAMELPGVQAGWISLRGGTSGFRVAAARNLPPALEALGALDGDCRCRCRLISGELDSVTNMLECERLQKATADTRGLLYHATVPLWLRDRTIGLMNLVGPEKGLFSAEELKVLYGVGNQLAVSLERARLHEHLEELVVDRTIKLEEEIEERKRIEQAQARMIAIIEATPDLVATSDAKGHVLYCNQAGLRMLGYEPGRDLSEMRFNDSYPKWAAKLVLETGIPHAIAHGSWIGETAFVRPDGREVRVSQVILAHRGPGGSVEYLSTVARDMSARYEAEKRQLRTERQLEQVGRIASLGRVVANIAHEFNNVLMGIQPFAEVIRCSTASDEKLQKAAGQIIGCVRRGKRVTEEILRFTQPAEPDFQPVVLADWLQRFAPELRAVIGEHINLVIEKSLRPVIARGDATQLQQVLTNLVLNARDAMPKGGTITLITADSADQRQFSFGRIPDGKILLAVRDTGSGMLPEVCKSIFEPMFTTKRSGTGLGLTVVHQIIERHEGSIHVDTAPGEGTTFFLLLPVAEQAVVQQDPKRVTSTSIRRVLLVEDEPTVAAGITALLEGEGIEVRAVELGAEAPQAAESFRPDAVILDLGLPDISGLDVYASLKTIAPDLPIIFSSGHADQAVLESEIDSSTVAFLRKPYEFESLLETLEKVVEEQGRGAKR